jgi:hypothetical protein
MEPEKRRFVRKRTDRLLYAEFGPDNGSILLNLCEEGCSFQSIAPVRAEQLRFSVSVGDGRKLEGDGQMVWSDTSKKTGGLRFLNPSAELREKVHEWLKETAVTTDGKLDPNAVQSEAKRRRKKLREEARAEAELAWKEGALRAGNDTWTGSPDGQTSMIPDAETTKAHGVSFNAADERARLGYGDSKGTWRGMGAILLLSVLLVALVSYRRELGHLVMSFGSSIAGEEQKTVPEATPDIREERSPLLETKPTALPDQEETQKSGTDAAETLPMSGREQVAPLVGAQAGSVRRSSSQQTNDVEDVPSLWTSVENGDTHAEVTLADRYTHGQGVPQSCAQARVLLEAAAKRGNAEAKQKLDELSQAGCP